MRLLPHYLFLFIGCFFSTSVSEQIKESRQSCSLFEDSLQCLCSNSYKSVTSVMQSSPTENMEQICSETKFSRLLMALQLPLQQAHHSNIVNNNGIVSAFNGYYYDGIFKYEGLTYLLEYVEMDPPMKVPLSLANFLSFPSYQKILTLIKSIQYERNGFVSEWRDSKIEEFVLTISTENIMDIICQASQLAAEIGDIGVKIQCKLNRLLQVFLVCGGKSEISLFKDVVTKKDLLKSLSIEIATQPYCQFKANGDFLIYQEAKNQSVFFSLEDLNVSKTNPLPAIIPDTIIEKERFSYLLLFTAARKSGTFTLTSSPRNDAVSEPVCDFIPGWKMEFIVFVREEGFYSSVTNVSYIKDNRIPQLFVSRFIKKNTTSIDNTCDILIVSRPTVTRQEWYNNFVTTLTPFLPNTHPELMAHSGFVKVAKAVDDQLFSYITQLFQKECSSINAHFTGHSLGAATGQILALLLRERMHPKEVKIDGVFFAPPNVFNKEAAEYYATVINSRIITHPRDPVTMMPCDDQCLPKGYPSCPSFDKNQEKFDRTLRNVFHKTPGRYSIPYKSQRESILTFEHVSQTLHSNTKFMKKFHIDSYYQWVENVCIKENFT
ncbi:uncharacterized protein LOC128883296 isoform X2 [Hylaeus volcanicus]|uniref:uncharacterized protein LOC128883296 isoform X2 n=1 Tax=Hylaeus volcanicus TaxID=313075 RepID=UPI0023B865C0|nr:uncharacterized protein LOC128883296 isoform X2 [Hylaeus volcanicus]